MGRQIEFFMDSHDEEEFMRFVRSTGDIVVLPPYIKNPHNPGVTALPQPASKNFNYAMHLFNRSVSSRLFFMYSDKMACHIVDGIDSSVVEFKRTIAWDKKMRVGRLYAEFKYVDSGGKWASKEPEFQKWYELLARWIRRNYSREIDPDYYFGPGALSAVKSQKMEVIYS